MNSRSIAVVGAGAWGMNLIRNFHTLGALRVVCDSALKRLELVRERYPDVECETEFANILKRDDITAVVIATPAPTHATLVLQALQADKDVFVEKPMALNFRDGERMVEEADKRGRILMVGHVLEYHPAIVRLRQLIDAGELGKLQYIYSNRLNLGRFRTEENALWSFAPHDIALMLRLLREMPKVITCTGGSYLNANVADVTVSTFEFASGVRGHIF
ncbi:MAG TPA: Gfo/Idh/MocA family oxidoreductase, partial [Armatimonadetes bacterium]|nr:Gfo/Idh/MocA family oxidoreductase [Armatimonadota bacterium]